MVFIIGVQQNNINQMFKFLYKLNIKYNPFLKNIVVISDNKNKTYYKRIIPKENIGLNCAQCDIGTKANNNAYQIICNDCENHVLVELKI